MTAPSQAIWPSDGGRRESGPPRSTQRRSADMSRIGPLGAIPYKIYDQRHRDGLAGPVHFCAAFKVQRQAGSVVHFASAIYK
jgi:hypothetical protein